LELREVSAVRRCRLQFVLAALATPGLVLSLAAAGAAAAADPVRDHDIVPEDYFDLATINSCIPSPDGHYVAYVESRWGDGKEGRQNDLWVFEVSTRERRRLTFGGFGAGHPVWSPDGRMIALTGREQRGGEERPPYDGSRQVWRIDVQGGSPFPLTRVADGVGLFDLTRDGRTLYYTIGEETYDEEWKDLRKTYADLEYGHGVSELNAVWKLDLESWRAEEVLPARRVIHEMALSPDRTKLAMITTEDEETIFKEGWSRVDVLDLTSGEIEEITSQAWRQDHPSPYGWLENLAWSRDSRALAFTIAYDGFATRLYVAEWNDGRAEVRLLARPDLVFCEGGLQWRGASRTLCYLGEKMACIGVFAVDGVENGRQGTTRELTPPEVVTDAFGFDDRGRVLVAAYETTAHMADLFLVDSPQKARRLTNLNPQVDSWRLPQIEHIQWTGADGDPVYGILELPPGYQPGDGPLPLIVELHGGPKSATLYRLRLWIYGRALMPANGYALLSPNYHGSTGYGDAFLEKLIGHENDIEVADILAGIDAVLAREVADSERIGVMGWSNGGYLVNCLIAAAPERFKAASSGAGVLDMVIQWGTEDTPGHVINYLRGLPWENPEAYRKASPLYHLGRVRTPTLIHVGGADPRVPSAHSRALYRALRHYLKVPVELVVYPGEGHGLSTRENRLAKMKWDLAWFDKYLLGQEEE
jgi:dipeptidyl aminopeptidase/acylaminoacyl peptidase